MCAVRIVLADDHDVVRHGLRSLIKEQPNWQIVGEVKDGREAVTKISELKPDVAVLDISMPSLNGLDAARQIVKLTPNTKLLILTMHHSEELIRDLIKIGVRGYILKADAGHDLLLAIQALLAGQTFFTRKAAQIVLGRFMGRIRTPSGAESESELLTGREREVVQLLAEGRSSKEVANVLNLSTKTVETHRMHLMRKLSCHSVSELVRYAVRNHLIQA